MFQETAVLKATNIHIYTLCLKLWELQVLFWNLNIIECLGLERTLKLSLFQPPCHGQGHLWLGQVVQTHPRSHVVPSLISWEKNKVMARKKRIHVSKWHGSLHSPFHQPQIPVMNHTSRLYFQIQVHRQVGRKEGKDTAKIQPKVTFSKLENWRASSGRR